MCDAPNDGEPAFPGEHTTGLHRGMTLRDWFAGQALGGVAGSEITIPAAGSAAEEAAIWCYKLADAMLEERDK